jgi:predicted GTPase
MSTAQKHKTTEQMMAKTMELYDRFQQLGDQERAEKAKLFLKKLYREEFIIAFCGHFSAGKSTMINQLTGEPILPSSPIPTSANLVKIRHTDKDFAKILYRNRKPLLFKGSYHFDTIKEFCKNGMEVESIEIGRTQSQLPKTLTVMDTPGIDSTDDAHRISTESALHLADMVFYVMDYNHVQSELNFTYTKELLSHGAKLYLIINQIDKHHQDELSFDEFRQSVYRAFDAWGVHPEGFYFTSLKEPGHPFNDFSVVKELVVHSIQKREELSRKSAEAMMERLIAEHLEWLKKEHEEKKEQLATVLGNEWDENEIFAKEEELRIKIEQKNVQKAVEEFENDRETILKNAYIMPAETRELAKSFLEAFQPDFKVGFFFSKKKTEEEKALRLEQFLADLQEKVRAQLEWHIRDLQAKWLKKHNLVHDELEMKAEEFTVKLDGSLLTSAIKPGAQVTGDSVLHYCDEVAEKLKKMARIASNEWLEMAKSILQKKWQSELETLQNEWTEWSNKKSAILQWKELDRLEHERKKAFTALKTGTYSYTSSIDEKIQKWEAEEQEAEIYTKEADQSKSESIPKIKRETSKSKDAESEVSTFSASMIAEKMLRWSEAVKGIPGFKYLRKELAEKANRLGKQEFTIALFGAFSAGKSSFANAMLGEKVLPVSPNPTTAAVNRIHPPNENDHDRTAAVHLKTKEEMLSDLQSSLGVFQVKTDSLEEGYEQIPNIIGNENKNGKENIHLSFLKAFYEGFPEYKEHLGETLVVDLNDFRGFVANERQSCFVESIDLYYDCEFTRLGITLVDTPGVDSINARHTGVAFEYIKNSDAILFVTYYNHAFSKADREFLIQLGRVKDSFELDKMFFIVNAIDLANDEEEMADVLSYVEDQLLQYGIRFPRIYGVSSLLALDPNKRKQSRIESFQTAFQSFLQNDLTKIAVQSAERDMKRAVLQLEQLIKTAEENQENRKEKKALLAKQKEQIIQHLEKETSDLLWKRLGQEIDELVYYVKQRVFYRLPDFFKESFNPSVLQQSSGKEVLRTALADFLRSIGFDFAQEMRATSLRAEKFLHQALNVKQKSLHEHYQSIQEQLYFSDLEWPSKETPDFPVAFHSLPQETFSPALALYKNTKTFFEKNEKQLMQNKLEDILSPIADQYLSEEKEKLSKWIKETLHEQFKRLKTNLLSECEEQFSAWVEALEATENIQEWKEVLKELQKDIA